MAQVPMTKWAGSNYHDQPDALLERSHVPTQGGFTQIPGLGTELAEAENLDYNSRGIGQRKGSEEITALPTDLLAISVTWTERSNGKNFQLQDVEHDRSSLWVAVGSADGTDAYIITSADGSSWTERANPKNFTLMGVAYNGTDLWVAVGLADGTDAYIVTSSDGTTWTERANPKNFDLFSVAYDGSALWTAVGAADGGDAYIITSPDGTNWTERSNGKNFDLNSVYHDQSGLWIAVGNADGTDAYIVTSSDGTTWAEKSNPKNFALLSIGYDGTGLWVAVGASDGIDTYIVRSSDGTNWFESVSPKNFQLQDIDHDGLGLWIAVGAADGTDGYIISSSDGIAWTERANPKNFVLLGISFSSASLWVAVGTADGSDAYVVTTDAVIVTDEIIATTEWRASSDGSRSELACGKHAIFTNQTGTWTQINTSAGVPFIHASVVTKCTFTEIDGHLNIHTDGALNYIQTYREGTDLDAELKSGNTYEDAQGGGTHTIDGTWLQGAYLGAVVNDRLAWSDGNVLIEATPQALTPSSGIWNLAGSTRKFFFAKSNIISLIPFIPHLSNTLEETLFVGTHRGFEIATGFLAFDKLVRKRTSAMLNHKSYFISQNWIVYLTEDKNVHAINRHAVINLGRRFKKPEGGGPLDGMSITDSKTNSFGFYDLNLEKGRLDITTNSDHLNDTSLVLDFKKGEPESGEPLESFERRVRCLVHTIKNPEANDGFFDMYQKLGAVVGVLKSGKLFTMETGNNDQDTIAIEAFLKPPVITGGDQEVSKKKTFGRVDIRAVPSADSTLSVDVFQDWSSTSSKTFSKALTADVGDIVKISKSLNLRAEAIQHKIYNNNAGETFVISSVKQEYTVGAEIRA